MRKAALSVLLCVFLAASVFAVNDTNDSELTGDLGMHLVWNNGGKATSTRTPTPPPEEDAPEGALSEEELQARLDAEPDQFSPDTLRELTTEEIRTILQEKAGEGETDFLGDEHQDYFRDATTQRKSSRLLKRIRDADATGNWQPLAKEVDSGELERFLVQFNKSCNLSGIPEEAIKQRIESDNYVFMILLLPAPLVPTILDHPCALKAADEDELDAFLEYARRLLKEEAMLRMKRLQLKKSGSDVTSYDRLKDTLEWDKARGKHSPLQQYVTPDEPVIKRFAQGKSAEELYYTGLRWLWVSDSTLFGEEEKWLYPKAFLEDSPGLERNPAQGTRASDCSEQANTLVSLLRASGYSSKEVRVGIGEIEFEENHSGGHAWAELRVNDTWVVLDSTVGLYYDEEGGAVERDSLPYEYWFYHPFPINDVWAYYNDEFFLDLEVDKAPGAWDEDAGDLFGKRLKDGFKESWWDRFVLWVASMVASVL